MGKIEIDHTGSGGGITLSSDGTSLLLGGTAIGGSALELYAENPSSPTAPSATGTNAVAIGSSASATSSDAFAFGYGAIATHWQTLALGTSRAFAADAVAIHIDNNSTSYGASRANSIAMGYVAKATGSRSVAIGGSANTADGSDSVAIGGKNNTAGTIANGYAIASGYDSHAEGEYSMAFGNRGRALEHNKYAHGMYPIGSQYGRLVLKAETTDATATVMISGGVSASTDNQLVLSNNSAFAFHGTIVSRQQTSVGTASAAWKIEGLIRREGSASTTTLVNSATTVLDNTPSWGMALSADTTNGCLKIEVTGAASTNIRWVATIHTSEVTY